MEHQRSTFCKKNKAPSTILITWILKTLLLWMVQVCVWCWKGIQNVSSTILWKEEYWTNCSHIIWLLAKTNMSYKKSGLQHSNSKTRKYPGLISDKRNEFMKLTRPASHNKGKLWLPNNICCFFFLKKSKNKRCSLTLFGYNIWSGTKATKHKWWQIISSIWFVSLFSSDFGKRPNLHSIFI